MGGLWSRSSKRATERRQYSLSIRLVEEFRDFYFFLKSIEGYDFCLFIKAKNWVTDHFLLLFGLIL